MPPCLCCLHTYLPCMPVFPTFFFSTTPLSVCLTHNFSLLTSSFLYFCTFLCPCLPHICFHACLHLYYPALLPCLPYATLPACLLPYMPASAACLYRVFAHAYHVHILLLTYLPFTCTEILHTHTCNVQAGMMGGGWPWGGGRAFLAGDLFLHLASLHFCVHFVYACLPWGGAFCRRPPFSGGTGWRTGGEKRSEALSPALG